MNRFDPRKIAPQTHTMICSGAEKQNMRRPCRRDMLRKDFFKMGTVCIADDDKMFFGGKIALGAFCADAEPAASAFAKAKEV